MRCTSQRISWTKLVLIAVARSDDDRVANGDFPWRSEEDVTCQISFPNPGTFGVDFVEDVDNAAEETLNEAVPNKPVDASATNGAFHQEPANHDSSTEEPESTQEDEV
eukprot:SAG31_NODE_25652_length_457_cov_0.860335_1_plen_107_part_10